MKLARLGNRPPSASAELAAAHAPLINVALDMLELCIEIDKAKHSKERRWNERDWNRFAATAAHLITQAKSRNDFSP